MQEPKIRFGEFHKDTWKTRKLSDIGNPIKHPHQNSKAPEGDGWLITRQNVYHNPLTATEKLQSIELDDKADELKNGDVIFTTSGGKGADVATASVFNSDLKHVYFGDFLVGWRPSIKFDNYFLYTALARPEVRARLNDLSQMGTSLANIKKSDIMSVSIQYPPYEVQIEIGKIVKKFDDPIHKIEQRDSELKDYKKWMIQNMLI